MKYHTGHPNTLTSSTAVCRVEGVHDANPAPCIWLSALFMASWFLFHDSSRYFHPFPCRELILMPRYCPVLSLFLVGRGQIGWSPSMLRLGIQYSLLSCTIYPIVLRGYVWACKMMRCAAMVTCCSLLGVFPTRVPVTSWYHHWISSLFWTWLVYVV